ncbi:uncharacterized protein FN964_003438 isoform 2-T2 [Alca torda]
MDHTAAAAGGSAGWRGADAAAPGGTLGRRLPHKRPRGTPLAHHTSATSVAPAQSEAPFARPGRERGGRLGGGGVAAAGPGGGGREARGGGSRREPVGRSGRPEAVLEPIWTLPALSCLSPAPRKRCLPRHGRSWKADVSRMLITVKHNPSAMSAQAVPAILPLLPVHLDLRLHRLLFSS